MYINAHSALRSSLIKMMWCLRRVHGILTCSVLSTRRRSSVTLPSGLRGILTCRVLSTRRRRAVRLPSGLRVLFSQLLFCLVHVTQSSCPLLRPNNSLYESRYESRPETKVETKVFTKVFRFVVPPNSLFWGFRIRKSIRKSKLLPR